MKDPITIAEACELVGRNKVNVARWIRVGYLKGERRITNPRQKRGLMYVDREEVLDVAAKLYHGRRTDLEKDWKDKDLPERDTIKAYLNTYYAEPDQNTFEDWQLEIARRVLAKAKA